ncbi:MAG TPA: transposase [Gaiellaceae bacterium]
MPRPPRIVVPHGIYHVYSRGNRRQVICRDDGDRLFFFALFEIVVRKFEWVCHSYCLMPNHYHFLIETPRANLSEGMQRFNGRYALSFNARHGLDGHLFRGRFGATSVETTLHLTELSRYVVLNPVRAGLCDEAADWPWSSYRAYTGLAPRPAFLTVDLILAQFGSDPALAARRYAAFVADLAPREVWSPRATAGV